MHFQFIMLQFHLCTYLDIKEHILFLKDIYFFAICLLKMFSLEITDKAIRKYFFIHLMYKKKDFSLKLGLGFLSVCLLKNVFT